MKKILVVALLFCVSLSVYSQSVAVQLSVKDKALGIPLQGAVVHYLNKHSVTDASGMAVLQHIPLGKLDYQINYLGYQTYSGTSEIRSSGMLIEILLEESVNELQQVVVCAEVPNVLGITVPEIHLHKDELRAYSTQGLGEALKSISGVTSLNAGSNIVKPVIHGMHSSRIVMMNNGVRQEDMEWGSEHAPNMDVNAYGELNLIKGASALRYGGDAVGGIIIAKYAPLPVNDTLRGEAGLTAATNGRGGGANILIQRGFSSPWALQVQGSYRLSGDLKAPDYYLTNSGVRQGAFMMQGGYSTSVRKILASYSYFNTRLAILSAAHIGNLADLANAVNSGQPSVNEGFSYEIRKPNQQVQHHLAKIEAEEMLSFGKISAQYAFQFNRRYEYDTRLGENRDTPSMNIGLATHSAAVVVEPFDFWNHTLDVSFGIDGMFQDNTSNPETQVKRLIPDYVKTTGGAFASAEWRAAVQTRLSAGIRFDFNRTDAKKYYYKRYWTQMKYDTDFSDKIIGDYGNEWLTHFVIDHSVWSGTLGISHTFSDGGELLANYSLAGRAPNPAELFSEGLHHSVVSVELGDVRIRPEKAHKFSLNYRKQFPVFDGLRVDVTAYRNFINDYIYQIPTGAEYTIRGAFPVWSFKQIDAVIQGVDLDVNLDFAERWTLQSKLAYLYGKDKTNELPLISMPPIEWNAHVEYRWNNAFKPYIRGGFQQVFQQKRFPNYDFTLTNVIENGQLVDKTVQISQPPKGYFLVDLRAGMSFDWGSHPMQVNLTVQNLLDTSYRNYLNRFRYFADEMGRQIQLQIVYQF
ncbi:MAG: TonB-dependent receptor [Capnocytophaga sp.]|nr:TonB-dependent receptor [Capnocytophaga sp.]